MPPLPARKRIANVDFEFDLDCYRGTAPMYFGSYALPIVETMKRYAAAGRRVSRCGREHRVFVGDRGRAGGAGGQVHCFEPVPEYFERVQRLADLNPDYAIRANVVRGGRAAGKCTIYVTREPGQSTLVPTYKSDPEIVSTMEVPVIRLDSYLEKTASSAWRLIKIDAEGFELPILQGSRGIFSRVRACRPAIICEIAPRAYPLMGRKVSELASYMAGYGYAARTIC